LKKAIYMLFITVGIILLLTPTCIDLTLKHYSNNIDIEEITAEKMEANNQRQAEFDFNAIRDVEISTVIDGVLNYDSELVIGTITIPDLDIYLPIMKGVTKFKSPIRGGYHEAGSGIRPGKLYPGRALQ
jgi:sortase A